MLRALKWLVLVVVGGALAVLSVALTFGTSRPPPELRSVSSPFRNIDFSDLPPIKTLAVGGRTPIAYRRYGSDTAPEALIALHGSSASSSSLHVLAKRFAASGYAVFVPDLRGHGDTGTRGDVDYAGQLDDDMKALVALVRSQLPAARLTLMGFSLSGGLVLRLAGGANGMLMDRSVLVSPMLGPQAPTMKPPGADPWARPHIPRVLALNLLNRVGITALDGLEAIAYAVPAGSEKIQTGRYSWRLLRSYFPRDPAESLRAATRPLQIIVGANDELFRVDQFEPMVRKVRADIPVTIVPGIDHVHMTIDPMALDAIIDRLK